MTHAPTAPGHAEHDAHPDNAHGAEHDEEQAAVAETLGDARSSIRRNVAKKFNMYAKESLSKRYKPMPEFNLKYGEHQLSPEAMSIMGKASLTALTLVAPPLGIAVGATAYVGKKLSDHRPFSWIKSGVKKGVSVAADGLHSLASTVTYPVRTIANRGMNVVRGTAAAGAKVLDATVGETWRGFKTLIDRSDNSPGEAAAEAAGEKEPNIPSRIVYGGGKALAGLAKMPFKLGMGVIENFPKHPIAYTIAAGLLYGAYNTAGGLAPAAVNLLTLVKTLGSAALNKLGIPIP